MVKKYAMNIVQSQVNVSLITKLSNYKYYRGHQIGAPYFDLGTT